MGNILPKNINFSFEKKDNITPEETLTLSGQIDDIAIHYILKQNTIDLLRLSDKEYYDNLIILTNKIFNEKLSPFEIGTLSHKIKGETTIQNAVFDLIPSNEKIKNQMIQNISKYYIKILTIYSAIVSTIDPQYSYEDENGEKQFFYLKDIESYKEIPHNSQPILSQLSNPMNLCRKRITILKNKLDMSDESFVTLNPGEKICETPMVFKLTDEIGIKELDLLYYDIFDYETKEWSKQSKEMKKKYNKDLTLFYQVFTGNKVKPKEIQSFKDIELLDFKGLNYCNDTFFKRDMMIPKHHHLIEKYLQKIKLIEDTTSLFRQKLITILKQLFLIKSVESNEPTYMINPDLTMDTILQIENETRDTIIKLYSSCERYFIQAILIFEELYEEQSFNISNEREKNINKNTLNIPPVTEPNMVSNSFFEPLYNRPLNTKEPPEQTITPDTTYINETKQTNEYEYIPKEEQLFESPNTFKSETPIQYQTQLKPPTPTYSYNPSIPSIPSSQEKSLTPNYLKPSSQLNTIYTTPQEPTFKNSQIVTPQPTITPNITSYKPAESINYLPKDSLTTYNPSIVQPPPTPIQSTEKPYSLYSQPTYKEIIPEPLKNQITTNTSNPSLPQQPSTVSMTERPYLKPINEYQKSSISSIQLQESKQIQPSQISQDLEKQQPLLYTQPEIPETAEIKEQKEEKNEIKSNDEKESKGVIGTIMNVFKTNEEAQPKRQNETEIQTEKPIGTTYNPLEKINENPKPSVSILPNPTMDNTSTQLKKTNEITTTPPTDTVKQLPSIESTNEPPKKSFFAMFSDSLKNLTEGKKETEPSQSSQPIQPTQPQTEKETQPNPNPIIQI